MPSKETAAVASAPVRTWITAVVLAWLVPGGGHFVLKRYGRAALLLFAVLAMFIFGLLMRGELLKPRGGDVLTAVMYYGGFLCNLATGLPYLITRAFYEQQELPGAVYDYGTKFLVTAGLLNVLAIVDAYEIASGRKN